MTPNPTVPRDLEEAYEDLVELVGNVSRGDISRGTLPEKVDEWRASDGRG